MPLSTARAAPVTRARSLYSKRLHGEDAAAVVAEEGGFVIGHRVAHNFALAQALEQEQDA